MEDKTAMPLPARMKAWVCNRYGGPDVLALEEKPMPVVGREDILIRIMAASVSSGDARIRGFRMPKGFGLIGRLALGWRRPRKAVLGTDFSGVVVAAGAAARGWHPGDEVTGFPGLQMGCHAQYLVAGPKTPLADKPRNLSHAEAASLLFGGMTAMDYLAKANIAKDEKVLVIGASGAVGIALVQLALHTGAEVTAVTSAANADLLIALRANDVIDYWTADFRQSGRQWDIIADTTGTVSFKSSLASLAENGRFLCLAGGLADLFIRKSGKKRQISGPASEKREYLSRLMQLAQQGVIRPVIDSIVDFEDLPQAHARVDTGRKVGSLVVTVG